MFRMLEPRSSDVFWLDAGADATEGWSFVGTGERSTLPGDVRLDVGALDPSSPPFSGGWVGWLDYESGAAAAGAPAAGIVDADPGAWLRATHVVAFDHERRRTWVLGIDDDLERWAAEIVSSTQEHRGDAGSAPRDGSAEGARRVAEARHDPG